MPKLLQTATQPHSKKGPEKKERGAGAEQQEEGIGVKGKPPKRSRRFAVVDEDEDFAELLEEYGDTWKDTPEEEAELEKENS